MSSTTFNAVPYSAAASRTSTVPWYIWTGVIAVSSASIGGAWDVSWHRSIGRDSFWTPAHMMIYACGVLAGIVGMYLVLAATFGKSSHAQELRAASVNIFGLWAPLGVFLAGWGGIAMLTSAPFDNWWHAAYGLDVKIISPPHALLVLGIRAVSFGMLFLILAAMNRSLMTAAPNFKKLQMLFLYLGGLTIGGTMFFLQEKTWDIFLHRTAAYTSTAIAIPILFATFAQASRSKWAATITASVYTIFCILEILILPLFPAAPKLGPVFYPVTHFVPAKFPILVIAPAFALDLLWQRVSDWKWWQISIVSGLVFVAVLSAVEWPFASFLMTKVSQNRFLGTGYFDYTTGPRSHERLRQFFQPEYGVALVKGLLLAAIYAMISTSLGQALGRWMRGVQR